jgi:hypothetical protein
MSEASGLVGIADVDSGSILGWKQAMPTLQDRRSHFIWVAATFETRREQITVLLRNWITELENWE